MNIFRIYSRKDRLKGKEHKRARVRVPKEPRAPKVEARPKRAYRKCPTELTPEEERMVALLQQQREADPCFDPMRRSRVGRTIVPLERSAPIIYVLEQVARYGLPFTKFTAEEVTELTLVRPHYKFPSLAPEAYAYQPMVSEGGWEWCLRQAGRDVLLRERARLLAYSPKRLGAEDRAYRRDRLRALRDTLQGPKRILFPDDDPNVEG